MAIGLIFGILMMTQVSADDLRSIDLRKAAATAESECVRCSETVGADHIEIVYFPECNRAGVAASHCCFPVSCFTSSAVHPSCHMPPQQTK